MWITGIIGQKIGNPTGRQGHVYIAYDFHKPNLYKIGFTKYVGKREAELIGANPDVRILYISKWTPCVNWLENKFHKLLNHRKYCREWFLLTRVEVDNLVKEHSLIPFNKEQRNLSALKFKNRIKEERLYDKRKNYYESIKLSTVYNKEALPYLLPVDVLGHLQSGIDMDDIPNKLRSRTKRMIRLGMVNRKGELPY